MCVVKNEIDMGFTDEHFKAGTHMCLIFNDDEERKEIIAKFIDKGISNKEFVGYFADEMTPEEVIKWLTEKGVKINTEDSNFNVNPSLNTYCPNGYFKPDEMLETLKNYYNTAINENYEATRVTGEMSWALKGIPGSERLMEYESKINILVEDYPVTAVCQYNANLFDGVTILECLKVHPFMIVRGQIVRNPYYLRPEEYLNSKN